MNNVLTNFCLYFLAIWKGSRAVVKKLVDSLGTICGVIRENMSINRVGFWPTKLCQFKASKVPKNSSSG